MPTNSASTVCCLRSHGEAQVLWAQTLERNDERLVALAGAPFLVQEQIPAQRHLRVVTLQERAWCCALQADRLPVDWRRDDAAHHSFELSSDGEVEQAALRLAHDMGLGYSSQDWIDTGNGAVFIDLNPAGQWLFLPEPVSGAVARAIAEHLQVHRLRLWSIESNSSFMASRSISLMS